MFLFGPLVSGLTEGVEGASHLRHVDEAYDEKPEVEHEDPEHGALIPACVRHRLGKEEEEEEEDDINNNSRNHYISSFFSRCKNALLSDYYEQKGSYFP